MPSTEIDLALGPEQLNNFYKVKIRRTRSVLKPTLSPWYVLKTNATEKYFTVFVYRLLLDHGAVADKRDKFDMDSVMHATLAAHCDVIQVLIDHCSDDIDVRHLSTEGYHFIFYHLSIIYLWSFTSYSLLHLTRALA